LPEVSRLRSAFVFACHLLLVACAAGSGPSAPLQPGSSVAIDRLALAAELDPGPIEPLGNALTDAARARFVSATPRSDGDVLREGRALHVSLLRRLGPSNGAALDPEMNVALIANVVALERIAFASPATPLAPAAALELLFLYGPVGSLATARDQFPAVFREKLAARSESDDRDGLTAFYARAREDASRLELRADAVLLRHGDGRALAAGLVDAARRATSRGDRPLASRLREEVVHLLGAKAHASDWSDRAIVLYENLDVAEGDKALAHLREALSRPPEDALDEAEQVLFRGQLARIEQFGRAARTANATRNAGAIDDRLAHASALFDLGAYRDAETELTALAGPATDDARPLVLLARTKVAIEGPTEAAIRSAAALVTQAGSRQHKDRAFYDAQLGYRGQTLMWDLLAKLNALPVADRASAFGEAARQARTFVQELEPYESDRASTLAFLIDFVEDVLKGGEVGAFKPEWAARTATMQRKFPSSPEVTELARSMGIISPRKEDSLAAIAYADVATPDYETLGRSALHLAQRVAVAAQWGSLDVLPTSEELAIPMTASPADASALGLIAADSLAARALFSGEKDDWEHAAQSYEHSFARLSPAQATYAIVSYTSALAAVGRDDEARALLASVPLPDAPGDAGLVMLARLAHLPLGADSEQAFADIVAKTKSSDPANVGARLWLVRLARDRKDASTARRIARDLLPDMTGRSRTEGVTPKTPGLRATFVLEYSFLVHFTPKGDSLYHLHFGVTPHMAILPTSGITLADVTRLAR
jgi:hypothetical protein